MSDAGSLMDMPTLEKKKKTSAATALSQSLFNTSTLAKAE